MKLVDVNILVYAYDSTSPLHARAKLWLESSMSQTEPVGFTIAAIVAFLRLVTDARIFLQPLDVAAACGIVGEWVSFAPGVLVLPTQRHWEILSKLAVESQARAALLPDAHLAACAIEHGATLYTHDRDFTRFPGVRVEFPLG